MALTITYDGYGVVANADALTNDTGGSGTGDWRELGGGSYSLSPDASKYGTTSIGSKYASKSGYTYIDGITPLDYSSGGNQEGELIYIWVMTLSPTPLDTIANTPYNIVIGDGTGSLNEYTVASKADSNGWDGRWRVFCIDPTITPTIDGGADLSAIDTIGVWMDTNVSVRAESFFISQIMSAKGLKVEGTSTTFYDDIVTWAEDYTNRAAGMFQSRGQTYYSLGSLTIHSDTANTVVSADGSNVEYEKSEFYNGSAWVTSYPTDANVISTTDTGGNTVTMVDTNIGISGNTTNKLLLDTSSGTSYTKNGGYFKYLNSVTMTSNDTIDGTVITLSEGLDFGGADISNVTIGSTTETTTGSVHITSDTNANALTNMSFNTYQSQYAVYVDAGVTSFTMDNWQFDNATSLALYWAGTGGTLTIGSTNGTNLNLTGCTTAGGTVSISQNVTVEVTNVVVGSRVRVDTVDENGALSTNLISEEATTSTVSTSVNYAGLDYTAVSIRVRKSSGGTKYLPYSAGGTISSGGLSASANQIVNTLVDL